MKNKLLIKLVPLLSAALLLSACVVQSSHPYYTKNLLVNTHTSIQGLWTAKKTVKPWVIKGKNLEFYAKNGAKSRIKLNFFKVNGVLYCDSTPKSPDRKTLHAIWVYHLYPTHLLSQVVITKTQIKFIPINDSKLKALIKQHKLVIPSTLPNASHSEENLYYATSATWVKFLKQYGTTAKLFNIKDAIILTHKAP
ncbi:hypothetical protein MNBD_GAMMA12-1181 [hydrothermal vent metagenome]|uniref:Lipoprotein n=1 Tax=hydrothermal vent metagenome TaxID=652676 RepID=A0A3B0YSM8_9ZZZZ